MLNDFHRGACGGNLSGLATTQNFLQAGYLFPSIFKDCIEVVKRCRSCQVYTRKMCMHPTLLFHGITIGPFTKWGIIFTTCNLPSTRNHMYIIIAIDYFTMWDEVMPTFKNDGETIAFFLFNQVISWFGIPKEIVTNHGIHFQIR